MNLEISISNAIDLTHRLEAALKVDDMDLCNDLLAIRGEAMAAFESSHRASTASQKEHCAGSIHELTAADERLQDLYKLALDEISVSIGQAVNSGAGFPSRAYQSNDSATCIDRKA